jgi:D-sedoheptulose 7-phosphate isomerase
LQALRDRGLHPTDNVSEPTARVNDDDWQTSFANWQRGSRIRADDVVLVFSVGSGNAEKNISANIAEALKLAKAAGAKSDRRSRP